ncbi:hypothetical protein [Shewanella sp. NIFS-20-20]|uniref:hypothetical protein n=1 Tax=Shewanella sp. NIFS-20-20 TaxID=2853806 RepID=UPI001C47B9CC|nr:hypothetical protein [Shewanella sp. NIFS-20-20]MBV7316795.1 hypothetical protein [Shewanella sp. NIFS-20-20]
MDIRTTSVKLTAALSLLISLGAVTMAQAVPWCHRGTIVQIADVSWSQAQIMANFTGSIPSFVADPEVYTTFTATHNYANTFAGGGGGFGGYSVPGSGQVQVHEYAPYTLTNMVGPGYYFTSQGVKFKLKKCYTIPPMTEHKEVAIFEPTSPSGGIDVKPYERLYELESFWSQSREEQPQR